MLLSLTTFDGRFARRDRDTVKPNVQKSAARLINQSNDGVTQFLEHAWIEHHAPGTFHVVGTVNLGTLKIAPPAGFLLAIDLFDHLVGAHEQRRRHLKANERFPYVIRSAYPSRACSTAFVEMRDQAATLLRNAV